MPDPVNINEVTAKLAELMTADPLAAQVLVQTMSVQAEIDPEAGYGALQCPAQYFGLELTPGKQTRLIQLVKENPYRLYVLVRAIYFKSINAKSFDFHLQYMRPFSYPKLTKDISAFCKHFNVELALAKCR